MKFKRLALIGCGLIGGSFALALKSRNLVEQVAGFSASVNTRQKALQLGVIDAACNSIEEAVQHADLVMLAVPVQATADCLAQIAPALASDALLMDAGSTKTDVIDVARRVMSEAALRHFVPAHPIAGKEVSGVEHAQANLFEHRHAVITPLPGTDENLIQTAQYIWKSVGSNVHALDANAHDTIFAGVSHLPHMLAFAAMNGLLAQEQSGQLLSLAGPGFRDFSRIAAADEFVWRDILSVNRDRILIQLKYFRNALDEIEQAMLKDDQIRLAELIQKASSARSGLKLPS